jgi:hypothetical protein
VGTWGSLPVEVYRSCIRSAFSTRVIVFGLARQEWQKVGFDESERRQESALLPGHRDKILCTYSNRPFAYGVSSGPTIRAVIMSGRHSATMTKVPSSREVRIFAHSLRMRLLRSVIVREYCNCLSICPDYIRSGLRKLSKITSSKVSEYALWKVLH